MDFPFTPGEGKWYNIHRRRKVRRNAGGAPENRCKRRKALLVPGIHCAHSEILCDHYVFGDRYWTINADIGDNASAWLLAEVDAARSVMDTTPQMIQNPAATCHLHHTLYSIGLYGYGSDTVMNTLGFTDQYKNCVALVEYGMNTNPEFGEEEGT